MFNVIDELEQEHGFIKQVCGGISKYLIDCEKHPELSFEYFGEIIKFFDIYVERFHHGKEEEVLFPLLSQNRLLKQGGPKCVLFMGLRIEHSFGEDILIEAQRIQIPPPRLRGFVEEQLKNHSALSIPLSEHVTGYYSIQLMRYYFKELNTKSFKTSIKSLKEIIQRHLKMLHYHIRKEDECLFVRARELLNFEGYADIALVRECSHYCDIAELERVKSTMTKYFQI